MTEENNFYVKDDFDSIIEVLKKYNSFALFCHINPDGDAIGSICSLKQVLSEMGKKAFAFCDGELPHNLLYLDAGLDSDESVIKDVDVCIMLDCNSLNRVGKYAQLFDSAKIKCKIDHHQMSDYTFDASITSPQSPSTCDIVYDIIKTLNVPITENVAQFLYAGIASDTGCFVHQSTTPLSHLKSYHLMSTGFDYENANYQLFKLKEKGYLAFLKQTLKRTKSYLDGELYITCFDYKHYMKYKDIIENCAFGFLDGIDGNEIRVRIFEKEKGFFSCALRSNKYANVCSIAKQFGGGGHIRASGFRVESSQNKLVSELVKVCKQEINLSKKLAKNTENN